MAGFFFDGSYISNYNVYLEKSDQAARSKDALDLYLPGALKKILNPSQDHRHFNILSVGSGDGEIDRHIIKIVQENLSDSKFRSTKIFNRALEPNADFVSLYKEKLEKEASNHGDQTSFEVCQKTFKEYVQSRMEGFPEKDSTRFDVVHFMYSLFPASAESDIEGILLHCFEHELKTNGQIVCITSEFIARNISPKMWGGKPRGEFPKLPEQIVKLADKRGWKVDHHKQEYSFDVTEVFDEKSKDGSLLLDFLTRVKNFRETAPKDKVEESLQVIRDLSTVRDGKYLIENEFSDILLISAK